MTLSYDEVRALKELTDLYTEKDFLRETINLLIKNMDGVKQSHYQYIICYMGQFDIISRKLGHIMGLFNKKDPKLGTTEIQQFYIERSGNSPLT